MMKIYIKCKSFDFYYIQLIYTYIHSLITFFNVFTIQFKSISMPNVVKKITVLRSPHIDKKSREQFQMKTYKTVFIVEFSDNVFDSVPHNLFSTDVTLLSNSGLFGFLFVDLFKNVQFVGVEVEISIHIKDYFQRKF